VSVLWWLDPAFADATGVAVMLGGFLFTFAGLVLVIGAASGRGPDFARELSTPWAVRPRVLPGWLALVVAAAVISAAVAAIETRGYSQNPSGQLPQCKWSIVKDHGQTNICVGGLVLFLAFEYTSFTLMSRPEPPRTDGATMSFS
jgi:hypothetical protein